MIQLIIITLTIFLIFGIYAYMLGARNKKAYNKIVIGDKYRRTFCYDYSNPFLKREIDEIIILDKKDDYVYYEYLSNEIPNIYKNDNKLKKESIHITGFIDYKWRKIE